MSKRFVHYETRDVRHLVGKSARGVSSMPYGLRRNKQNLFEPNEDWPAVLTAYQFKEKQDYTYSEIAKALNSCGFKYNSKKHGPIPFSEIHIRSMFEKQIAMYVNPEKSDVTQEEEAGLIQPDLPKPLNLELAGIIEQACTALTIVRGRLLDVLSNLKDDVQR